MINDTRFTQSISSVDSNVQSRVPSLRLTLSGITLLIVLLAMLLSVWYTTTSQAHAQLAQVPSQVNHLTGPIDDQTQNRPVLNAAPIAPANTTITTAPVAMNMSYRDMAVQAALNAGISPDYFVRQIQQESGFNPNATSPVGAIGIAQFMPATAASMGVNPYDPSSALNGAARWMAQLNGQFGGNYAMALAAYNAGPGAVQSAVSVGGGNWLAYMPAETQNYVRVIMG